MKRIYLPPSPLATSETTKSSMQGNKSSNTKSEQLLAQLFHNSGLNSFLTNNKNLPGTPDFSFEDFKIAIFIHGCFWHRCPYCAPHFPNTNQHYWSAKFLRNKLRDQQNKSKLRSLGWRPIVIWECKLKRNPAKVICRVKKTIGDHI